MERRELEEHLTPQQMEDNRLMQIGFTLTRMAKSIAGLLARQACLRQGINPDRADEWDRGKVRIEWGAPVPDEAMDPKTGAVIYRLGLILVQDKYLWAQVQIIMQPPKQVLELRGIVGAQALIDDIDPEHSLPIEWLIRADEVDSGNKIF